MQPHLHVGGEVKSRDIYCFSCNMAADTSTSTGSFSFTVDRWLKAVNFPEYTTAFTTNGHVNYGSCINLSEEDVRAVGVEDEDHVRLLMRRVKELRKLSEEDAVKLLWVSTCNYYTVCIKGNCGSFLVQSMIIIVDLSLETGYETHNIRTTNTFTPCFPKMQVVVVAWVQG